MASLNNPKRPRLSLQTKPAIMPSARTRNSLANADPKSPTAFNTLSNVYVTAIERSTPVQSTPVTAINLFQSLKLQTNPEALKAQRTQTPYTATLPDTPLSANPRSPMNMEIIYPSTMTATPPLSAGPVEPTGTKMFSFASIDTASQVIPMSPAQSRRKAAFGPALKTPYTHPRSLHSILRNSPLPPRTAVSPISPRRQSLRLQEKAARRVGYESPLTQTITTEKYVRSHVDLLAEDASPWSISPAVEDSDMVLDLTLAYSGNETRDGGQTPGPFEEVRRRMAGLETEPSAVSSPRVGGIRKKKRKEKKRKWVWTIGQDAEENESGAIAALRAAAEASTPRVSVPTKAATPEPVTAVQASVEPVEPQTEEHQDVEMSDFSSVASDSRATTPFSVDLDLVTPTVSRHEARVTMASRLGSVDLVNSETGSRRDTPIPPDLVTN